MRAPTVVVVLIAGLSSACPPAPVGGEGEGEGDSAEGEGEGEPLRDSDSPVVINEVSAFYGDYIELFNPSDAAAPIAGFQLTSASDEELIQVLGAIEPIPARSLLLLEGALRIHIADRLGGVRLVDADGALVDEVVWDAAEASQGATRGRFPDGADGIQLLLAPTPGTPNRADAPEESPLQIVINELTSTGDDQVELFVVDGDSQSHELWVIDSSNNPGNQRAFFSTFTVPGSFVVLSAQALGFGLKSEGDAFFVFDARNRLVDEVRWGDNEAAFSYCRVPDGTGAPAPCSTATFGFANVP